MLLRFYNGPEFVVCWLAVLRIGAIAVATMPLLKARELSYVLNDSEAKAALVAADLYEEFAKARRDAAVIKEVITAQGTVDGCRSYERLIAEAGPHDEVEPTDREDPALLAYTSGSTARHKGTLHKHEEILVIADTYAAHTLAPTEADVFGGHPSLAFTYGLGGMLVFPFRFGASTVLLDKFTPETLLDAIERYGITIVFCTPTIYKLMLRDADRDLAAATRTLRFGVSAGEHLPASTYNEWKARAGGLGPVVSARDADRKHGSGGPVQSRNRAAAVSVASDGRIAPVSAVSQARHHVPAAACRGSRPQLATWSSRLLMPRSATMSSRQSPILLSVSRVLATAELG